MCECACVMCVSVWIRGCFTGRLQQAPQKVNNRHFHSFDADIKSFNLDKGRQSGEGRVEHTATMSFIVISDKRTRFVLHYN